MVQHSDGCLYLHFPYFGKCFSGKTIIASCTHEKQMTGFFTNDNGGRLVVYSGGWSLLTARTATFTTHEWMFWVFEGLFMIVALTVFFIWYPKKYFGITGTKRTEKLTSEITAHSTTMR